MARTFYNPYERDPASINTPSGPVKIIKKLIIDLSPLPAASTDRYISISGDQGAIFNLEIKNEDNYYYNFIKNVFQATKSGLYNQEIQKGLFKRSVTFPTVTDNDKYDIYITADPLTTAHADYYESRFKDGSLDINSSTGSNSLLITKVIYQYLNETLTISPYSPSGTTNIANQVNDTVSLSRGLPSPKQAFSISCSISGGSSATACYRIIKQPVDLDIISFIEPVIGSDPITIEGEDIYPAATTAFTGDDINGAITSGAVVRMDNTDLSAVIKVGDKITTPVTTDTVNGARDTSAVAVTMDSAVATKMAVGDRITSSSTSLANDILFEKTEITVASLDSTNVFSMSSEAAIVDNATLTFSSKINRSLTTVTVVETSSTATDFTMSQAIQFRDNAPLTFFNQMNYQWPIDNFAHIIKEDMVLVASTNIIASSSVKKYEDITTIFPNTRDEKRIINKSVQAVRTLAKKPTITDGLTVTQEGSIVFNKQQALALKGDTIQIGGYGSKEIKRVSGYDVVFTDLAITLSPVTTTTTAASSNSTSVVVASRTGILDDVSVVSGIGINPNLVDPTVDSGAGAVAGAGTIVLTAAQSLESGITLTFANAGTTATITGNIEVIAAGNASETLRFDVDKLLSVT